MWTILEQSSRVSDLDTQGHFDYELFLVGDILLFWSSYILIALSSFPLQRLSSPLSLQDLFVLFLNGLCSQMHLTCRQSIVYVKFGVKLHSSDVLWVHLG